MLRASDSRPPAPGQPQGSQVRPSRPGAASIPNGQRPVGDPIVPRPRGSPHRGPRVVAELARFKAPVGRFSRLSSLHLCVLAKSANVHFRQRRKFTALPCSSYPQRATARRGPHKPALLGFGLFIRVQIYCQAGVFPKRGYAPFWSVGGGCREGKSKSPPCRFFGFLNRFFALKEMV